MENRFLNQAFTNIKKLIEQRPQAVAQLFNKHGINAAPTYRNVANAIKVKPSFGDIMVQLATAYANYKSHGGGNGSIGSDDDSFTGFVSLTGDQRITLADKLANAGIVFSNIIRDSQRQPEPYNQVVPAYYEPSGKYNVHTYDEGSHVLGMDKKLLLILGAVLVAIVWFQLHKK